MLKLFVHFTESISTESSFNFLAFYFSISPRQCWKINFTIYGPKKIIISWIRFWFHSLFLLLIADNYRTIASDLCSLAKSQGSRDNISVIVVYLKEPQLIAKQSWPSTIEPTKDIMENLNMYEEPPVANPVTMDALGNTNQVSFSHERFIESFCRATRKVFN